jgi:hypothetical protein
MHVYECLIQSREPGEPQNFAWDLMAECHGPDWHCPPEKLGQLIIDAINHIEKESKNEK